jgi:hypothetical protein
MLYMDMKLRSSVFGMLAIISMLVVSSPVLMASAQQQPQQQPQQQQGGSSPAVSSICKMVQDNRFLAGIAGLDQAVNICNNLSTGNSGQVLSQLCSVIGGLKIINVESICKQQTQQQTTANGTVQNQNQTLSKGSVVSDNNNTNASNSGGSSNSIIDKTMGMLKGYLGK